MEKHGWIISAATLIVTTTSALVIWYAAIASRMTAFDERQVADRREIEAIKSLLQAANLGGRIVIIEANKEAVDDLRTRVRDLERKVN